MTAPHLKNAAGYEAVDLLERYNFGKALDLALAVTYLLPDGRAKREVRADLEDAARCVRRWLVKHPKLSDNMLPSPLHYGRSWRSVDQVLADFGVAGTDAGDAVGQLMLAVEIGAPSRVKLALGAIEAALAKLEVAETKAKPPSDTVTLRFGDPRWEAWVTHWTPDPRIDVRRMRTLRAPFMADGHWPPPSFEVQAMSATSWRIPYGTPEHAAWCCLMRRRGEIDMAQSYELNHAPLLKPTRWPEIDAGHQVRAVA